MISSSSKLRHGGARPNSGGARPNSGGARPNSGGPRPNSGGYRPGAGAKPKIPFGPPPPPRAQPPAIRPDAEHWYVVRALHGQTDRADEEIRDAGFEVVTARICRPATRARRSAIGSLIRSREERFEPLFPHYIIVRLRLADQAWKRIVDMESVGGIIGEARQSTDGVRIPIPVPDAAIEHLRKILSPAGVYYPPGYVEPFDDGEPIEADTALHMRDGPLSEYAGICARSDGKRVQMLMGWFGRDEVVTHVRQSAVEAA